MVWKIKKKEKDKKKVSIKSNYFLKIKFHWYFKTRWRKELEIIRGLNNNIKKFKALIFEGDFDESYINASSFSSINLELSKNFFVGRINLHQVNLSQFYTESETLPISSDTIVLNKNFFNLKLINSKYIDVLYVLNFFDLILFFLEKKPQLINNCCFKKEIHIKISQILNEKLKKLEQIKVKKIFIKNYLRRILSLNKYYESNFLTRLKGAFCVPENQIIPKYLYY